MKKIKLMCTILFLSSFLRVYSQKVTLFNGKYFDGTQISLIDIKNNEDEKLFNLGANSLNNKISSIKIDFIYGINLKFQLYEDEQGLGEYKNIKYSCDDLNQIQMNDLISCIKVKKMNPLAYGYKSRNDTNFSINIDNDPNGFRFFGVADNSINYFAIENGYAAILYENADDAHDKLHKGFGKTFVIVGQGLTKDKRQAVGPEIRGKVSFVKIVPENEILNNL